MKHTLEIEIGSILYGEKTIISGVYMNVVTGNIIGLLGRNGEGKSSLLRAVFGTKEANNKSIRIDGEIINSYHYPPKIRYLPHHYFIPKHLSIERVFNDFDVSFAEFSEYFPEIKPYRFSKMKKLSGGMCRMVEIYVIIKSPSQFVLLDEPFSQISPIMINKLKLIIEEECFRKGFIITDHLYRHILNFSNSVYLLSKGRMKTILHFDELISNGYIRE